MIVCLIDLGITGDGRCLFRSVIHGAWLRAGKQSPSDSLQRELADELRARVQNSVLYDVQLLHKLFCSCISKLQWS